jgi:transglutaminase-like putative cysteine protease
MTQYSVRHRTTYRYLQDVSYSCHLAHLVPRDTPNQKVTHSALELTPHPARRHRRSDYFGNAVEWFAVDRPHTHLEVLSESTVTVLKHAERKPAASMPWEAARAGLETNTDPAWRDAVQYMFDAPMTIFGANVTAYAEKSFTPGRPILEVAIDLMARIHKDFRYDTTVTDATTPVDRVFEIRSGVCQDLAHVGIACMRSAGLTSRYVSGYLLTMPPPGQPRLLGADASHAWFSVWAPPFGWVDLDPTNNILPEDGHVTAAWGRDFSDVSPLNGIVTGGGDHIVEVGVDVIPAPTGA